MTENTHATLYSKDLIAKLNLSRKAGGRRQKAEGFTSVGIQTPPEKEPPFRFASPSLLKQQDRAGSPNFQFGILVLNPRPYGRGKRQIAKR
ncbi:hypothetical protein IQ275_37280 [Nostoc sp. LEGE 12450]|nr:hypothetical protein [Nostoc sp. LEGE 12450]